MHRLCKKCLNDVRSTNFRRLKSFLGLHSISISPDSISFSLVNPALSSPKTPLAFSMVLTRLLPYSSSGDAAPPIFFLRQHFSLIRDPQLPLARGLFSNPNFSLAHPQQNPPAIHFLPAGSTSLFSRSLSARLPESNPSSSPEPLPLWPASSPVAIDPPTRAHSTPLSPSPVTTSLPANSTPPYSP